MKYNIDVKKFSKKIGLSQSTIYRKLKSDSDFIDSKLKYKKYQSTLIFKEHKSSVFFKRDKFGNDVLTYNGSDSRTSKILSSKKLKIQSVILEYKYKNRKSDFKFYQKNLPASYTTRGKRELIDDVKTGKFFKDYEIQSPKYSKNLELKNIYVNTKIVNASVERK